MTGAIAQDNRLGRIAALHLDGVGTLGDTMLHQVCRKEHAVSRDARPVADQQFPRAGMRQDDAHFRQDAQSRCVNLFDTFGAQNL